MTIYQVICARQLQCTYQDSGSWGYWPNYDECRLFNVDLSKNYKTESHSFSGSSSQKSGAMGVTFYSSNVVEFIPKEIIHEFPNLVSFVVWESNAPIIKTDFFSKNFVNLQFLNFWNSKVEFIESEAFSELVNLKQIYVGSNQLKALKFRLFQKNLKLEIVRFESNKIVMMNPNLFEGLENLKFVIFYSNQCVSKRFGCETCTVSQTELKSGLTTCFNNCADDSECKRKSSPVIEDIYVSTSTLKAEITSSTELIDNIDNKLKNLEAKCETISKNQNITIEKIFQKTVQVEGKVQENLAKSQDIFNNLEVFISKESNFLNELNSVIKNNFESQNLLIDNTTEILTNSVDQTISSFKTFFQDILVNKIHKIELFSETIEKSNNETAENLKENLETKIDKALQDMKNANNDLIKVVENSNKETREYLENKVESTIKMFDESNQETRQYMEESNKKTVQSLKDAVLKATEERVDKAVELVDAKLAKTELALELEKANRIIEKNHVLLLEGKIKKLEDKVKSLEEKLSTQAQEMERKFNNQMVDFVEKQLEGFEKKLREDEKP